MATFFLLPPRACLEQAVGELFGKLLPGLLLPADAWDTLAAHLAATAGWPRTCSSSRATSCPKANPARHSSKPMGLNRRPRGGGELGPPVAGVGGDAGCRFQHHRGAIRWNHHGSPLLDP